jgi:hypothetical protein
VERLATSAQVYGEGKDTLLTPLAIPSSITSFHLLDERDTNKTCSGFGHLQDMPLWKRVYRCGTCGLVMDRDENSARNILRRFLARPGLAVADATRYADVFTATDNV